MVPMLTVAQPNFQEVCHKNLNMTKILDNLQDKCRTTSYFSYPRVKYFSYLFVTKAYGKFILHNCGDKNTWEWKRFKIFGSTAMLNTHTYRQKGASIITKRLENIIPI